MRSRDLICDAARRYMPRESFLLRTDAKVLAALRKWAEDDLRSINGQLDFILRKALKETGRLPHREEPPASSSESDQSDT